MLLLYEGTVIFLNLYFMKYSNSKTSRQQYIINKRKSRAILAIDISGSAIIIDWQDNFFVVWYFQFIKIFSPFFCLKLALYWDYLMENAANSIIIFFFFKFSSFFIVLITQSWPSLCNESLRVDSLYYAVHYSYSALTQCVQCITLCWLSA